MSPSALAENDVEGAGGKLQCRRGDDFEAEGIMIWQDVEQFIPFIKPLFDGLRSARDLFRPRKREKNGVNIKIAAADQVPSLVKDVEFLLNTPDGKPLSIRGKVSTTIDRLRVFVDYSLFFSKWQPPKRVAIGELRDVFRGQPFEMQLIYAAKREGVTDRMDLWWGDPAVVYAGLPPANPDVGGMAPLVRCRLAILGASGEEQHYYFLALRTQPLPGGRPLFVFSEQSPGWVTDWGTTDF